MMYFLHLGQLITLHYITMVKVLYPSHGSISSAFRDQNGSEQNVAILHSKFKIDFIKGGGGGGEVSHLQC